MKKILSLIIIMALITGLYAQSPGDVEFPSISGYTGNQNNPVSYNTGAVSQSVPIWDANQNDLSIPVFLSFNSNGIKVSEVNGTVGLGWSLIIGGSIQVEQRGVYDFCEDGDPELGNGFKTSGNLVDEIPINRNFLLNSVHPQFGNYYSDTEPDIFHYSFPGSSGKFVFNNNGEIISLTDKNLKIDYTVSGAADPINDEITIINSSGIKYFFKCTAYTLYEEGNPTSPYFSLYKVENLNTGNFIQIDFYNDPVSKTCNSSEFQNKFNYECDGINQEYVSDSSMHDITTGCYLVNSIQTKTSEIFFTYINDSQIIDKITISLLKNNQYKEFKEYRFTISGSGNNRNLLSEIHQFCNENFYQSTGDISWISNTKPYIFEYTNSISSLDLDKTDYWGYKNGIENDLSQLSTFAPDASKITNLKKIIYPTGGSMEYEFEFNEFTATNINGDNEWTGGDEGAGLRVSKIINDDAVGNQSIVEYDYYNGKLSSYSNLWNHFEYLIYVAGAGYRDGHLYSYSSNSFSQGGSFVQYSNVTEYKDGKQEGTNKGKNGKIEYTFKNDDSYEFDKSDYTNLTKLFTGTSEQEDRFYFTHNGHGRSFQYNYPDYLLYSKSDINGLLLKTSVFNNENKLLSETENIYDITASCASTGLKVYNFYWYICFGSVPDCYDETRISTYYGLGFYKILQHKIKLTETVNKVYDKNNENIFSENKTLYTYAEDAQGNLIHNMPVMTKQVLSNGDTITDNYHYTSYFEGQSEVINEMLEKNIYSLLIESDSYNNSTQLSGSKTEYRFEQIDEKTIIVPDYTQIWEDGNYITSQWFDKYDDEGHLLESHSIDMIHKAVLYGYNNSIPVASVANAYHSHIFYTSFEEDTGDNILTGDAKTGNKYFWGNYHFDFPDYFGVYIVSYWEKNAEGWNYTEEEISYSTSGYDINGVIDEVRAYPRKAYMTSATYMPHIGKTSASNANSISVYYEYDTFGRLIKIYDQDKNLIKENEYNYADFFNIVFEIQGETTICENCTLTLEIVCETPLEDETVEWQWFINDCGNELIETGMNLEYQAGTENFSVFARPVLNGRLQNCKSVDITVNQE